MLTGLLHPAAGPEIRSLLGIEVPSLARQCRTALGAPDPPGRAWTLRSLPRRQPHRVTAAVAPLPLSPRPSGPKTVSVPLCQVEMLEPEGRHIPMCVADARWPDTSDQTRLVCLHRQRADVGDRRHETSNLLHGSVRIRALSSRSADDSTSRRCSAIEASSHSLARASRSFHGFDSPPRHPSSRRGRREARFRSRSAA